MRNLQVFSYLAAAPYICLTLLKRNILADYTAVKKQVDELETAWIEAQNQPPINKNNIAITMVYKIFGRPHFFALKRRVLGV
jgi:hypothetical protein